MCGHRRIGNGGLITRKNLKSYLMDSVVECNVWCVGDEKAASMGLPEGDSWMPFAVDFCTISSIKLAGETDFIGNDKATIYFHGREVTIDIPYRQAVKLWREFLIKEKEKK